jgi:hypothetical protein
LGEFLSWDFFRQKIWFYEEKKTGNLFRGYAFSRGGGRDVEFCDPVYGMTEFLKIQRLFKHPVHAVFECTKTDRVR